MALIEQSRSINPENMWCWTGQMRTFITVGLHTKTLCPLTFTKIQHSHLKLLITKTKHVLSNSPAWWQIQIIILVIMLFILVGLDTLLICAYLHSNPLKTIIHINNP